MPTGLKDGAQELTPPQTRVLQAWTHLWRGTLVDGRRKAQRTMRYADAIRKLR